MAQEGCLKLSLHDHGGDSCADELERAQAVLDEVDEEVSALVSMQELGDDVPFCPVCRVFVLHHIQRLALMARDVGRAVLHVWCGTVMCTCGLRFQPQARLRNNCIMMLSTGTVAVGAS